MQVSTTMRLSWDSRTSAWIAILSLPFSSLKVGNSQLASFLMFSGLASGSNQVPGHGASLSMMRLTLTSPIFQVLIGSTSAAGRNLTRFNGGRQRDSGGDLADGLAMEDRAAD